MSPIRRQCDDVRSRRPETGHQNPDASVGPAPHPTALLQVALWTHWDRFQSAYQICGTRSNASRIYGGHENTSHDMEAEAPAPCNHQTFANSTTPGPIRPPALATDDKLHNLVLSCAPSPARMANMDRNKELIMKYLATAFSAVCISFGTASPALSYHNCGTAPSIKEVVCEVVKWTELQREWSQSKEEITLQESQVICVADGFNMTLTIQGDADRELKKKIFIEEPTKLEVCIQPHP